MESNEGFTVLVRRMNALGYSPETCFKTIGVDAEILNCLVVRNEGNRFYLRGIDGLDYTTQGVNQDFDRDSIKYKSYIESLKDIIASKKEVIELKEEIKENYLSALIKSMEI